MPCEGHLDAAAQPWKPSPGSTLHTLLRLRWRPHEAQRSVARTLVTSDLPLCLTTPCRHSQSLPRCWNTTNSWLWKDMSPLYLLPSCHRTMLRFTEPLRATCSFTNARRSSLQAQGLDHTCDHGAEWNTWTKGPGWLTEDFWQTSVSHRINPQLMIK